VTADRLSEVLSELGAEVATVDLALIPVDGLAHGRPEAEAQRGLDAVLAADLLLVVTPIYKATYTGLLKLLFDAFQGEALRGKVAIPVMLGAWPGHLLALEHALKPLFAALGAVPARGLFVAERTVDKETGTVEPKVIDEFRPVANEALRLISALAEPEGQAP
jgi:FMN reductase